MVFGEFTIVDLLRSMVYKSPRKVTLFDLQRRFPPREAKFFRVNS